ncbi:MAG: hypothetical protein ACYCQI_14980, partial [Gammaproteobacteria bacterium]
LAVPITQSQGPQYTCHVSLKNPWLAVALEPSEGFEFQKQSYELTNKMPEKTALIHGTFRADQGYIFVDAIRSGMGWATVRCAVG